MFRLNLSLMNRRDLGGSVTRQENNVKEKANFIGENQSFLQNDLEERIFSYMKMPEIGSSGQYSGCQFRHLFPLGPYGQAQDELFYILLLGQMKVGTILLGRREKTDLFEKICPLGERCRIRGLSLNTL